MIQFKNQVNRNFVSILILLMMTTFYTSSALASLETVTCELMGKKSEASKGIIGYLYVNKNSQNLSDSKFLQFYVMHKNAETNKMVTDKEVKVSKIPKRIVRKNKFTKSLVFEISVPSEDGDSKNNQDFQCQLAPDIKI